MKKLGLAIFIGASWLNLAQAADVALVYENEAAVTSGKFIMATVVPEGVLISAQLAMKAGNSLLAGPVGKDLYRTSLIRLDNDLDSAVIRLTEPVKDTALQSAYQQKAKAVTGFLPQSTAVVESTVSAPVALTDSSSLVVIKLNGEPIGTKQIEMKSGSLRKSKFKVELIFPSTATVWNYNFELTSIPKMSFWKEGRQTGLNEIPRPVFTHDQQAMFNPLRNGKSSMINIEGHFIDKEKPYVWTMKVKTKQGTVVQTANVIFHD